MIEEIIHLKESDLIWLDLVNPSREELEQIANTYQLHPTSVQDCMDSGHLPKLERIGSTTFMILRAFDQSCKSDSDTVQDLTRKVAVFFRDSIIITVHRTEQEYMKSIKEKWRNYSRPIEKKDRFHVLGDVIQQILTSYHLPLSDFDQRLSKLETLIFRSPNAPSAIEEGYYFRRKSAVFKRMLRMTAEILSQLQGISEAASPFFQDLRETAERMHFNADEIHDDVDRLLNLHIALASQKTNEASHQINEVMRVLTIFSVFFLPLSFIAGVYGMNFEHMPELHSPYGYAGALIGMVVVAALIFFWFRKRGWLT
jgi:magnesium transporter